MDKLPLVIEEIILEYVNQLIFAEKYAKVIRQIKDEVIYGCEEGARFSHLCFSSFSSCPKKSFFFFFFRLFLCIIELKEKKFFFFYHLFISFFKFFHILSPAFFILRCEYFC